MPRNAFIALVWVTVVSTSAIAQQSPNGQRAGEVGTNPRDGGKYAWVPAGTKLHGFWIGQNEVTVGAYKKFVAATSGKMPPDSQWNPGWDEDNRPIVNLTWDEAAAFCSVAGGRLPSEEEWEYAARAGNESAQYGAVNDIAWYAGNSGQKGPLPAKQKEPNAWGLYDMLGNVWEWTTGLYPLTGKNDGPNLPPNPGSPFWALRGGSWEDPARLLQVSVRGRAETSHRSNSIGARCVIDSLPGVSP